MVKARDIDRIGVDGVIKKIKERVQDTNVYISVDIDVLDPAFAPATGTYISESLFPNQKRCLSPKTCSGSNGLGCAA